MSASAIASSMAARAVSRGQSRARQLRERQPARRRAAAKEVEVMPGFVVGDEVDRGEGVGIGDDAGVVDAFARPHRAQHRAVDVAAERREIADLGALARRRDREVRRVAAEALQIEPPVAVAGLVELDHRLAEGEDVEHDRGLGA